MCSAPETLVNTMRGEQGLDLQAFMRKLFAGWFLRLATLFLLGCHGVSTAQSGGAHSFSILDAVRSTLSNHPQLGVQRQQVVVRTAMQEQASSIFDTILNSNLSQSRLNLPLPKLQQIVGPSGVPILAQRTDLTSGEVSGSKLFRNGTSLSPSWSLTRDADTLNFPGGLSTSHVGLLFTVPLAQGRGRTAVTAPERAATIEVTATSYDLSQLTSDLIQTTASSYWNLVAALKNLKIAVDAEERGQIYVENVQALIDADQVPKGDIDEVRANLAARTAVRIGFTQQVMSARQQLAIDMGNDGTHLLDVPDPSEDFPIPLGQPLISDAESAMKYYFAQAKLFRADYLAAEARQKESRILTKGAEIGVRPLIDLSFGVGYTGVREGTHFHALAVSPFYGSGADLTAGISYTFPPANHLAQGKLLQARAQTRQADLQMADTARNINSQIIVAVSAIRSATIKLDKVNESVAAFESSLTGEREKYRLGTGSVVDILTVEDRLTTALTNQVQAQLAYALAIVSLRHATGTYIAPSQTQQAVGSDLFYTVPFATLPEQRK